MPQPDNLGPTQTGGAASAAEVARYDSLADRWWDPSGPMRPLHAMNPLRTRWVHERLPGPGALLDVGCGAGLASEAFARLGHAVTGIDAAPGPIAAAVAHAGAVPIHYRVALTGDLVTEGQRFAAVTALEVIEHVPDTAGFLHDLSALVAPGGQVFISTLNRTARSLLVAKWGAEYVLRMLPVGTHDWHRFITPTELARWARAAGLRLTASAGLSLDPFSGRWRASRDLSVNYIAAFEK